MSVLSYVNTKMGTDSTPKFSKGNTLPLCALPFSMVSFCPQTEILNERPQWFYDPNKPYMQGIRLTHQASPWIGDYGTILFSPQSDVICEDYNGAHSSFDLKKAKLEPDYLSVYLNRNRASFELTPTKRCCAIRLKFDTEHQKCLSIFSVHGNTEFKLLKSKNTLLVSNDYNEKGDVKSFKTYIAIKVLNGLDKNASRVARGGFHLFLNEQNVQLRVGISYISYEMALESLSLECGKKSFEAIRKNAKKVWNEHLLRLDAPNSSKKEKEIFYSCLYRAFLFPRIAYEQKKDGSKWYFSPCGKVKRGVRYTDHGTWDTYRTLFPLFADIARDEYEEILQGMLNDYYDCKFLPRWSSFGEVGCMPSTLVDAIIAHAVACNIGSAELHEKLLEAMLHHANNDSGDKRYGRYGILEYKKYGYVPSNLYSESVNLTLDFSYGDWCIAKVAESLGKKDIANEYYKRAQNYKNLFDKTDGFFKGKNENGEFISDFDKLKWGGCFTEACAYQCLFGAPHALDEIANLLGSKAKMLEKVDEIFETEPNFRIHGYGWEIHEMSEMALSDLGQCAISNQPSFSIPFLYAYFGKPEKTRQIVEKICNEYFTNSSYPGDEDTGSMSAWYIFARLGKFPICPGNAEPIKF